MSMVVRLLSVLVVLALGLTACGSDDPSTAGADGNGAALAAPAFEERVEGDDIVVLDVRTPEEYAAGHLPDAINIDVSAPDFGSRVEQLDKEAAYAVYCRSGNRSAVALDQMLEMGFTDVAHLDGGIVDWQAAGGAVVTG